MYCFKCGQKIPEDSDFCPYCGAEIPKDKPKKEIKQNPVISIMAIVIVVIVIMVGVMGIKKSEINANRETAYTEEKLDNQDNTIAPVSNKGFQIVDKDGSVLLTGEDVSDVSWKSFKGSDGEFKYTVKLSFTDEGTKKLETATEQNLNNPVYIMVNDEVMISPVVTQTITNGMFWITDLKSQEEAAYMADSIEACIG